MSQQIEQPYQLVDSTNGIVDELAVSDSLLSKNSVRKGINVMFDRPRGAISQRYGTTLIDTTVGSGNILGLHDFRPSTVANRHLLTVSNGVIYRLANGTTWTSSLTGLNATANVRFIEYLDEIVFMNGIDASKSWAGSGNWATSSGALDVGSFPKSKYAVILNSRIFVAGDPSAPDTVTASSLESGSIISWTSGTKSFRVYPNNGDGNITGLAYSGRMILIFKDRGLYRYDDNELQPVCQIGTPSYESIINDDNGVSYFFGQGVGGVGFYKTKGGFPVKISRPIIRWTEAIAPSFYDDVCSITNGNKIMWSVGSITMDGTTYSNTWYVWNIADESWEIRNYADRFMAFSQFIDSSGNIKLVGGDTDAQVQVIDSGYTDNGTPIESECELGANGLTSRGRIKVINEIVAYAKYYQGLSLLLKVDDGEYKKIGTIDKTEKVFKNIEKFRGHKFYFKISAVNSGIPWQFDGLELPSITSENYG